LVERLIVESGEGLIVFIVGEAEGLDALPDLELAVGLLVGLFVGKIVGKMDGELVTGTNGA